MSGIEPVTMPDPPEVTKTCMWLLCEGDVRCKVLCHVSSTGTKIMQSGVWQVCTPAE
jgi:hypothetical protein